MLSRPAFRDSISTLLSGQWYTVHLYLSSELLGDTCCLLGVSLQCVMRNQPWTSFATPEDVAAHNAGLTCASFAFSRLAAASLSLCNMTSCALVCSPSSWSDGPLPVFSLCPASGSITCELVFVATVLSAEVASPSSYTDSAALAVSTSSSCAPHRRSRAAISA